MDSYYPGLRGVVYVIVKSHLPAAPFIDTNFLGPLWCNLSTIYATLKTERGHYL